MRYLLLILLLIFPFVKSFAQAPDSTGTWVQLIDQISSDSTKVDSLSNSESNSDAIVIIETKPDSSYSYPTDTNQTNYNPVNETPVIEEVPVSIYSETPTDTYTATPEAPIVFETDTLEDEFKPEIGLGAGVFSFMGDINDSYRKNPFVGRIGRSVLITRKITDAFSVNFFALQGVLTGNERNENRNLNFQTDILIGGSSVSYNFYHLLKKQRTIMPYISLGIESFEFNSKGDLRDSLGRYYHYWSDGSIREFAEDSPYADVNNDKLQRDYIYETDLRDLDADEFGKYPQIAFSVPIDVGIDMKVTSWITLRLGNTFHFSFSDLVDNVSSSSVGIRKGNNGTDKFMYSYFTFRFNFFSMFNSSEKDKKYKNIDFSSLNGDEDSDGVLDFTDLCPDTPSGSSVDLNGCPADSDGDGIKDPYDSEQSTSTEVFTIDENGVGKSEEDYLSSGVADSVAVDVKDVAKYTAPKKKATAWEVFSVEIPPQFVIFDKDNDKFISSEELSQAFDMFFDFDTTLTVNDMYMLTDFFFEQTMGSGE